MIRKKRERAPINISKADIERAFKKVEEFQNLIDRGKTPEQIFKDMLRLIQVDE